MAEENEDGMEKSEEPTEQRREDFRKKGDIPNSKELTSVGVLFTAILVLTGMARWIYERLHKLFQKIFRMTEDFRVTKENFLDFFGIIWVETLYIIIPLGIAIITISATFTLGQTRGSFAMKKLAPNWKKFNPLPNIKRIFGIQASNPDGGATILDFFGIRAVNPGGGCYDFRNF